MMMHKRLRPFVALAGLALTATLVNAQQFGPGQFGPGGNGCPATKGFWKNQGKHPFPKALVFPISVGGVKYNGSDFYAILGANGGGNAVSIMGSQLVAAILNIENGAQVNSAVTNAVISAEDLLFVGLPGPPSVTFPINMVTGFVAASSALGHAMTSVGTVLDEYNNAFFGSSCTEGTPGKPTGCGTAYQSTDAGHSYQLVNLTGTAGSCVCPANSPLGIAAGGPTPPLGPYTDFPSLGQTSFSCGVSG